MMESSPSDSLDAPPGTHLRPRSIDNSTPSAARAELEALYRSHFTKLKYFFRRFGESDASAHDLAQETFVQALRGLHQFDGRAQLSTWLWTIARNAWRGHMRKSAARGGEGTRETNEAFDFDTLTAPLAPHLNETCDCVRRGFASFAKLHPERAQAIYLSIVEGWTCEELAASLGRTTHATTEYLSQCRAKLRPFIADCDDKS